MGIGRGFLSSGKFKIRPSVVEEVKVTKRYYMRRNFVFCTGLVVLLGQLNVGDYDGLAA
jgi:hypothetical protein